MRLTNRKGLFKGGKMLNCEKKSAQECFDQAIKEGRLSKNPNDTLFAGHWMYMYSKNGKDFFKNINTREYLP
jgi:hypothetical protein